MIFKDKNPSVFAGLVAALGVSAVLVAPDVVIAEEVQAALVPDQAVSAASAQGQEAEETGEGEKSAVVPVADSDEGEKGAVNDADADADEDAGLDAGADKGAADADSKEADVEKDADDEASGVRDPNAEVSDSKKSAADLAAVSDDIDSNKVSYKDEWVKASDGSYTWYGADGEQVVSGWVVTDKDLDNKTGGLQRYWIKDTGYLAMSELLSFGDFWSYATAYGYVVRGKHTVVDADGNTLVYLADNDGRLESAGWHVTSAYGDGLQRYYVESDTHSARVGYSESGYAHYTTSAGYVLRGAGSASDGNMYYAGNDGALKESGWLVTTGFGQGLQRYWLADYKVASEGVYQTGASSWTYATSAGYVLRGALTKGALVYLADNDGLLAGGAKGGWVVSSAYGQGLQRYWIEADKHAAQVGYSTDGYAHYTTSSGYVLRGALKAPDGSMYYADNDGGLQESGWLVTSAYGQGLQRYWLADYKVASEGLYQTGASSWTYATANGYVLRGKYAYGRIVYLADNDGLLAGGAKGGWVVSSAYGQGLQRYWIDPVKHAAIAGYDDASTYEELGNYAHFTTEDGYVLRGVQYLKDAGRVYLGDNDGRLARGSGADGIGWLVTDAYGQGLQRYWIEYGGWAQVGFSESGYAHYTTENGYVLRGGMKDSAGDVYYADNDGRLQKSGWRVTADITGVIERYWMQDYKAAKNTFVNAGNGWWAYCKSDGTVLRGTGKVDGKIVLADNDGRLAGSGWAVKDYGKGLQRYYLGSISGVGYGYALTGFFQSVLGSYGNVWFYGDTSWGYVLRGKNNFSGTGMLISNNEGVLAESLNSNVKAGMVVTSSLGAVFNATISSRRTGTITRRRESSKMVATTTSATRARATSFAGRFATVAA